MRIPWIPIFVVAGIALIALFILDVALGEPMALECVVTGKYYVPPSVNVTSDGDGGIDVSTDPEEFHVTAKEVYGDRGFDVSTKQHLYATLTNGQTVRINARLGKWTGSVHVGSISP